MTQQQSSVVHGLQMEGKVATVINKGSNSSKATGTAWSTRVEPRTGAQTERSGDCFRQEGMLRNINPLSD